MHEHGGVTTYTPRRFGLFQIGQRDRTWDAGFSIAAGHWAWGIGGADEWRKWMQRTTSYPFDSPHNAILETLGGYGMLGLALYVWVIVVFVRNYVRLSDGRLTRWQRLTNEWTFMAGIAIFATEMVDVLTVFGVTVHALMAWAIFGAQAGIADAAGECRGHDQEHSEASIERKMAR